MASSASRRSCSNFFASQYTSAITPRPLNAAGSRAMASETPKIENSAASLQASSGGCSSAG